MHLACGDDEMEDDNARLADTSSKLCPKQGYDNLALFPMYIHSSMGKLINI